MKVSILINLFFLISNLSFTQVDTSAVQNLPINKKRLTAILGTGSAITGSTIWFLWDNWFKDAPSRSFHFTNDSKHWLQMDKLGHGFSAYYISSVWKSQLEWANVPTKKAAIYGSLAAWFSVTSIDIMDGFSSKWGFSNTDFIANTLGTGLFLSQELLWKQQRISIKWSFHSTEFPAVSNKLGDDWRNEWLHDYNGQTYWLSANLNSFFKHRNIPKILNLAVGYGAHNMLSELETSDEISYNNQRNTKRIRQFYFSPDLDLTKIRTKSKFVKILLSLANAVKIPMPTLEYNSETKLKLHFLYF